MNTMFYTKILGGVSGSLLILLLLKWGADVYYQPAPAHGEHAEAAYAIAVEDDGPVEEVVEVSLSELLAVADINAGARQFGKCKACHKIGEGEHGIGPSLFQIVGRTEGGTDYSNYSGSLVMGSWTPEELDSFLENPKAYAPNTTMNFGGFSKATDRANIIAYLGTL